MDSGRTREEKNSKNKNEKEKTSSINIIDRTSLSPSASTDFTGSASYSSRKLQIEINSCNPADNLPDRHDSNAVF